MLASCTSFDSWASGLLYWEDIVYACIWHAYWWYHVQIFHLTWNNWLRQNPEEQAFAWWPLSVGEGTNWQYGSVEYTMPLLQYIQFGGRIAVGVFSMELTRYLQPPPRSLRYLQRGQHLLLKMKWWMNSTQHSFQVLWDDPHHGRLWQGCPWDTGKARHFAESVDAVYAPEYIQILIQVAFQKGNQHSKQDAQWYCVQPTSFPSPLQLNKTTHHLHLHTCSWGLQFGRWTWWEASVHSLIHPILT